MSHRLGDQHVFAIDQPGWERFGLIAIPQAQWAWLDDPYGQLSTSSFGSGQSGETGPWHGPATPYSLLARTSNMVSFLVVHSSYDTKRRGDHVRRTTFIDRSVFVKRHTLTGKYNPALPPLRTQVNQLTGILFVSLRLPVGTLGMTHAGHGISHSLTCVGQVDRASQ